MTRAGAARPRVAIVGVGLIGGSAGMAARIRLSAHVTGWDADPDATAAGVRRGALDEAAPTLAHALEGASVALVATPVETLERVVGEVLSVAGPDTTVTDAGSTKRALVDAIYDPRFVGGHPVAGAETGGVAHAREDLFDGATWYLTPRPGAEGVRLERLHRFAAGLGAVPAAIDAALHDRLMAAISHLPHVIANVLVEQATAALGGEVLPATGPSFRDATRVAGANPAIWPGIYASNREALTAEIDGAIARLQTARDVLNGDDAPAVRAWQEDAAARRRALLDVQLTGVELCEVRAAVPNRPGVIADLALALGAAGINIHDMSLSPSPDNSSGVIALWVAADSERRAAQLVREVLAR